MLTKEDFFKRTPKRKEIDSTELGGKVLVQELTLGRRNDIHERSIINTYSPVREGVQAKAKVDNTKFVVWTIIHGVVNPDGTPMFVEGDYDKLASIVPFDALDTIASMVWHISGTSIGTEKNVAGEK